jgi:hypothetical protein
VRAHRWLALLPAIGMLAGIPLANRVEPYVLGLPFLLFWIVAWVVAISGVMGLIYAMDRASYRSLDDDAEGAPPADPAPRGARG